MTQANINIHKDTSTMFQAVATRWATIATDAIAEHGSFHVALAGGSTPQALYHLLATREIAENLPWDKTHIYFGDERCVQPDHSDSNFHMASKALLNHVPVPDSNIHRIPAELADHDQVARDYELELQQALPKDAGAMHFDLVLLGLGPDGHTASLFPNTLILSQRSRSVNAVYVEKFSSWRISITYPVIEQAHHTLLLVAGSAKAEIVNDVLNQSSNDYPVVRIAPYCEWHMDNAAAALIPNELLSNIRTHDEQDTGC